MFSLAPWTQWVLLAKVLKKCTMNLAAGTSPGWPDLANFRPLGDGLTCAVFVTEVAQIFGLLFSAEKVLMYVLIMTKIGWAISGHPVLRSCLRRFFNSANNRGSKSAAI
jgi:hypothetical protein